MRRAVITLMLLAIFSILPNTRNSPIRATATPQSTEIEWMQKFGGVRTLPQTDMGRSVATNGVQVAAVGTTTGAFPGHTNAGAEDAYIQLYDITGNLLWTRQFGTDYIVRAHSVDLHAGAIYVAGYTAGNLPGQSGQGNGDAYLRAYDENGADLWTRQFGTESMDLAFGVAADDNGIYVVGQTSGLFPGQSRAGSIDAFIRKYDTSGNELWTRQFGSPTDTRAYAVVSNGTDVWVAGDVSESLPNQTAHQSVDAFIRRYTADGTEVWTRQFGTDETEEIRSVAVDDTGVYVAGTGGILTSQPPSPGVVETFIRKYTLSGDIAWTRDFATPASETIYSLSTNSSGIFVAGYTDGTFPGQTNVGGIDAYVRHYNTDGSLIWTRQFGTTTYDTAQGVAATDANLFVVGSTDGTLPQQTSLGLFDAYLRRYDADGSEVWTRQIGATQQTLQPDSGLALTTINGIYVAGYTLGALPGQTHIGEQDVFVRRYNTDGTEVWTKQFGTTGNDRATALISDGSAIYVAGDTSGALTGQTYAGGKDAYIRKYDDNGTEEWTHQFGTENDDDIRSITLDTTGIYVVGSTEGELPQYTNPGGADAFIRKYAPDGTELWTVQFAATPNNPSDWEYGYAEGVTVFDSYVYVVGYTTGAFPGQTSTGNWDAYLRKYDTNGAEIWTRQFGSDATDLAYAVAANVNGVYIVGHTEGTLPNQLDSPIEDAYIRAYDHAGVELWTHQFGSTERDYAYAVSADDTGIYMAGNTDGMLPGVVGINGESLYVRKYNKRGMPIWTIQFGSTYHNDEAHGIALDSSAIYVTGETEGELLDDMPGPSNAFLAKLTKDSAYDDTLFLPLVSGR